MLRAATWPWRSATTQCSIRTFLPVWGSGHYDATPNHRATRARQQANTELQQLIEQLAIDLELLVGVVIGKGDPCPGHDHLYLFVGVEIIIIVGDCVLNEAAYFLYLFWILTGFFGSQGPVLEFSGLLQIIGNAHLPENTQGKEGKDSK